MQPPRATIVAIAAAARSVFICSSSDPNVMLYSSIPSTTDRRRWPPTIVPPATSVVHHYRACRSREEPLSSFRVYRRRFAAGYAATDNYDTRKSLLSACNITEGMGKDMSAAGACSFVYSVNNKRTAVGDNDRSA
jgi:hypothetical protein